MFTKISLPIHPQTTPSKTKAQNNDLLDNLFGSQASNGTSSPSKTSPTSAEDDFDPRAGEAGVEKQDFGDFNSAFGNAAAPANGWVTGYGTFLCVYVCELVST